MTSYYTDRDVTEDTRYILDLLLAADGLKFSHQHGDASYISSCVKVTELASVPSDSWSHDGRELDTAFSEEGSGIVTAPSSTSPSSSISGEAAIIEAPFTRTIVTPELTPGASKHYKQEQLDKIAEQIKRIGDQLNPEIEQRLQNMLLKKVLLSSSEVTYSTFEEWMKEFLTENQYSLVDKSDKYKVHLFLMCVKLSLKTAKKQLQVTSAACQKLYDFSVSFVVRNFPDWIG